MCVYQIVSAFPITSFHVRQTHSPPWKSLKVLLTFFSFSIILNRQPFVKHQLVRPLAYPCTERQRNDMCAELLASLYCILLRSSFYLAQICSLGCCLCLLFMARILALRSKVDNVHNTLIIKKLKLQLSAYWCWDLKRKLDLTGKS